MRIIRLLGGASVQDSDGPATARAVQRSRMALLALVALSRTRSVSRERLMALLWPDSDAERARHLLRESLYRLRETLGDRAILGAGDEIRLDPTRVACDVWMFEAALERRHWQEADRLYTGPLLDGVFLSDAADFEHWLDAERLRLVEQHARAVESLATERGASGDVLEALALWRRLAAADPHNSRIALRVMEALDAAGDRAGALRHAATHAAQLESELNATPDPAVAAFAERLRRDPTRHPTNGGREDAPARFAILQIDQADAHSERASEPKEAHSTVRTQLNGATPPGKLTTWPSRRRTAYGGLALAGAIALFSTGLRIRHDGDALDRTRVAVVPFRTSGADSAVAFLHDGLAELLAVEFNGELGPTAVDAGEVLRAWPRAQFAEPATPVFALEVARRVRAGQVVYGAVIGSPQRLTITASVLDVSSGAVRVAPVQVRGPLDSLPAMVAMLSAKLLSRDSGAGRLGNDTPENTSTDALRAYLHGMAEYRKANWIAAGKQLFHALELDSSFTPAAYRFALIHAITAPTTPLGDPPTRDPRFTRLYDRLWKDRERLSAEQRQLLEAVADSLYVLFPNQTLVRLERTVGLLPNSVEAWDILGNAFYHAGALVGREDWSVRAKDAFVRALTLDSTFAASARMHLADLAFIERDRSAHARYAASATAARGPAYLRYQSALLQRDPVAIRAARIEYSRAWVRGDEDGIDWAFRGLTLPQRELDSVLAQLGSDAVSPVQRDLVAGWLAEASLLGGRPSAAQIALRRAFGADSISVFAALLDHAVDDRRAEEGLLRALPPKPVFDPRSLWSHPVGCNVALARLRRDDTTGVAEILATEPLLDDSLPPAEALTKIRRGPVAQAAICGQVLRGVLASRSPFGLPVLLRADSIMRLLPLSYTNDWNYDLALALARRGQYGAAAAAARRHFIDLRPLPRLVLSLREEGRWAALAGDTSTAIRAYKHYLLWREAPEAALIPQRDSVRAELAALEKARK